MKAQRVSAASAGRRCCIVRGRQRGSSPFQGDASSPRMHSVTHTPGFEPVPWPSDDLLLERDPELASLGQRFAALCTGSSPGGSVLLSGEAGVGKTTVLRAAARRSDRRIDWLWGTCEPMLSPTPLGP